MARATLDAKYSPFPLELDPRKGLGYSEIDESSILLDRNVITGYGKIWIGGEEQNMQIRIRGDFDIYGNEEAVKNSPVNKLEYAFQTGGSLSISGLKWIWNDLIIGTSWMDSKNKIYGSTFDDIINGGAKNDILWGDTGADTFVASAGKDKIKDFSLIEGDRVQVEGEFEVKYGKSKTIIEHDEGRLIIAGNVGNDIADVLI